MRIYELLEAKPINQNVDIEHYGIWQVEMSNRPVKMPAYTGNVAQYVAKVTDKRTGKSYIAAGIDQASAREAAIAQGVEDTSGERSSNPADYNGFDIHFNVNFGKEFYNPKASIYFKFMQEGGQTLLVRASRAYVAAFGNDLKDLGFQRASIRYEVKGEELSSPILSFYLSRRDLVEAELSVGMRYQVTLAQLDSDENELFIVEPVSKVQMYHHKEKLNVPGFTINGRGYHGNRS